MAGLLVALALGLAGCTRILLSQADWVAVWYVNDYFRLDPRQEALVRDSVRRNVAAFRSRDLPEFLRVIGEIRGDLRGDPDGPVTPAVVARRAGQLEALGLRSASLFVPDAVVLLRTLSDAQVDEFFVTLQKNAGELAEEYSGTSPAERRTRQQKQILKFTRRMTGTLSREQEALVRGYVDRLHDLAPQWLDRRLAWQQELRASLAGNRGYPEFDQRVASLILAPDQFDSPGYRQRVDENRAVLHEMVAALLATLTKVQREHVDRELRGYERTLVGLATA